MNKKRGFVLIESIFMIVFISVALLLVYKAFSVSFQDESKRVSYDNTNSIYETYYLKQYFEETGILDYLVANPLTDGYLEVDCTTLTSNNNEYCDFLVSVDNFDINKMYITKEDMDGIDYTNLEPTTIDYFKTLSNEDSLSYRFIVWFNNGEYASLKLGEPFYILRVLLDGGTWNGVSPEKLTEGSITTIAEPTKENFIFNGWTLSGTGSTIDGTTFTMGTADTLLIANWSGQEFNYAYTGDFQTFTAPTTGYYLVETWGAEGGEAIYTQEYLGGKGSYASGKIYLTKDEVIYIYVGGKGQKVSGTTVGTLTENGNGYNGGGFGAFYTNNNTKGGGGGATDIRYFGATTPTTAELLWNSSLGLNSRIMVAGGGGGGSSHSTAPNYSGTGGEGSILGGFGIYATTTCYAYGTGGTQISGGVSIACPVNGLVYAGVGSFGIGHTPYTAYSSAGNVAGGGGGYYGGGGGFHAPAGGGSSFTSGYAGVNAITSALSTTATNNTKHYSNYYFIDGEMQSGINTGNGKAKITYINDLVETRTNTKLNNVRYIKDCINGSTANIGDHWVELQAIYQGFNVAKGKTVTGTVAENASYPYSRIVDGDITSANYSGSSAQGLQCIIVDLSQTYNLDEIAVWHYWLDGRTYYSNTTYVSSDNSTWIPVIATSEPETNNGKRVSAYDDNTVVVPIYRVTNLLLDPTFSGGNTNWENYSASSSFSSGTASITATSQYGGLRQIFSTAIRDSLKGHQVYGSSMLMANSTSVYWVSSNDGVSQQAPLLTEVNTWQRLSAIQAFSAVATSGYVKTQDARTSAWVVHYMKEPLLIDLTSTFGAGNEPTKEWCDANIDYFAGTQNLNLSP